MTDMKSPEVLIRKIIQDYFPYANIRDGQDRIMSAVIDSVSQRRPLLINAETGVGKTVAVLTPLYYLAEREGHRILYTTRTLSQSTQALIEFERISKKCKGNLKAVSLQGRLGLCPMIFLDKRFEEGVKYDEFREICERLRESTRNDKFRRLDEYSFISERYRSLDDLKIAKRAVYTTCPFYFGYLTKKSSMINSFLTKRVLYPDIVFEKCLSSTICPYEVLKDASKEATMIVLPYIYIFNPRVRQAFIRGILDLYEKDLEEFVLVVDEAHNLPDYLRDLLSSKISTVTIKRAQNELKNVIIGHKDLQKYAQLEILLENNVYYLSLSYVLKSLENALIDSLEESPEEDSVEISLNSFLRSFFYHLTKDSFSEHNRGTLSDDSLMYDVITYIAYTLSEIGNIIREYLLKIGMRPRSYIGRIGDFLIESLALERDPATHFFLEKHNNIISLRMNNFNIQILSEILKNFHTSIHMSGTLKPFDSYAINLGIENAIELDVPADFIRRNRIVFYYPKVTTKYENFIRNSEEIIERLKRSLMSILSNLNANTIVLFPSYEWMTRVLDEEFLTFLDKNLYGKYFIESKDTPVRQIQKNLAAFKSLKDVGAVFFGVFGGRISEGVDFPHEELRSLVIVGLPYPKPDAPQKALYNYYKARYGEENAWHLAFEVPMIRKVLQAIGRLVRDEKDYGIAIILDSRAKRLRKYIQPLLEKTTLTDINEWLMRLSKLVQS